MTWILDFYPVLLIVFNQVSFDSCKSITYKRDSVSFIVLYLVWNDNSIWMKHNYSILVSHDYIRLNQQWVSSFYNENTLLFWLLNMVKLDICFLWVLAAQGNVGLQILIDVICNNVRWTSFFNQNSLATILKNCVAKRNVFVQQFSDNCSPEFSYRSFDKFKTLFVVFSEVKNFNLIKLLFVGAVIKFI